MLILSIADIEKLAEEDKLTAIEQLLFDNCRIGGVTELGNGDLPEGPSPERSIRAGLLRYLILGGCRSYELHGRGVVLRGAWIDGELDLRFAKAKGSINFVRCGFGSAIMARQARLEFLRLDDCSVPALDAEGATIKGDVMLRGLRSSGEVSFGGAEIGGQLSCMGAILNGNGKRALVAQRASISDGVFLRGLKSLGEVSLSGAEIGGQLTCKGADLNGEGGKALDAQGAKIGGGVFLERVKTKGELSFSGAEIGNQFVSKFANLNGGGGKALNGERMIIKGSLLWRDVQDVVGIVTLAAAHLENLADDEASWTLVSDLILVGVTYDNLVDPLGLSFRKIWLRKGAARNGKFHPQPYQQLAKFYRETGHRHEAREILIEKEREQRKAVRASIRKARRKAERNDPFSVKTALSWSWNVARPWVSFNVGRWLRIGWNWLWDILIRYIAGYGYKPWFSLWWLCGLVVAMMVIACFTWNAGDFAPNSAIVLTSSEWKALADLPEIYTSLSDDAKRMIVEDMTPAHLWSDTHAPGKDYETFYSFAYALDVVVPVLDLGQTDAWAPSPARGGWGYWMFYAQKMFVVLGWVVTAIAAAAISGMIRRDD